MIHIDRVFDHFSLTITIPLDLAKASEICCVNDSILMFGRRLSMLDTSVTEYKYVGDSIHKVLNHTQSSISASL